MKCTLGVAAGIATATLMLTGLAQAADMPIKGQRTIVSYYNWTGFYLGINGGYGFGTASWDVPAVTSKPKGMLIGGTAGYNYQVGSIVYGLEGDMDYSTVKGSVTCGGATCETKNIWLATVRGRLGYAFDRWLPYITAGGAVGNLKATNFNVTPPNRIGATGTPFGWTAGVGLEYAFLSNWSAKVEYLYVSLPKFSCLHCGGGVADNVSFNENMLRVGLNYKFMGPIFSR